MPPQFTHQIGVVFTIPLVYAMGGFIPAISSEKFFCMGLLKWLELILATLVVLWDG